MKEDSKLQGLCKECTHRNSCKDAKRHLNMTFCSQYKHWKKKSQRKLGVKLMTIIVNLEVSSPYDLTPEEIEKDLRMAEDQIGWNYDYVIKSVEVS